MPYELLLFHSYEISSPRIEHLSGVCSPLDEYKPRKKSRILQEYFETVFIGTCQRRKDERQRCCICGRLTVVEGRPTGHARAHYKWGTKGWDDLESQG